MALIQTTVDDDVKARADAVFSRSGLTSAMAMRVMITQVANSGISPFDGLFSTPASRIYSVRLAVSRGGAILLFDEHFTMLCCSRSVLTRC